MPRAAPEQPSPGRRHRRESTHVRQARRLLRGRPDTRAWSLATLEQRGRLRRCWRGTTAVGLSSLDSRISGAALVTTLPSPAGASDSASTPTAVHEALPVTASAVSAIPAATALTSETVSSAAAAASKGGKATPATARIARQPLPMPTRQQSRPSRPRAASRSNASTPNDRPSA